VVEWLSGGYVETKSTFEDLEVWQEARKLRNGISLLTKRFPADERFRLVDQLVRASRSVTANIAEGYGRFHFRENMQFCRQARGSLYETIDHLTVALDEKYLLDEEYSALRANAYDLIKRLNG
jgi:four helix bundle protein